MTKAWNPSEHHVTWCRVLHADQTYTYVLKCDGKDVYVMDGSTEGRSSMDVLTMHSQFIDLTAYYQKNGHLPSRFKRGIIKRKTCQ